MFRYLIKLIYRRSEKLQLEIDFLRRMGQK